MARAGDVIFNPRSGERIVFLSTGTDDGGDSLVFDYTALGGLRGPPPHIHSRQQERFEVLAGAVVVRVRGSERVVASGDSITVPVGVAHSFANAGPDELHMRIELRPAGGMDRFFETVFRLAGEGKSDDRGRSGLLQDALFAREYGLFLAGPPVALQRPAVALLARLARWRGLRAE